MKKVAITINETEMDFESQLKPLLDLGFNIDFIPLHHTTNAAMVGEKIKTYNYCIAGSENWDKTSLSMVEDTMELIMRFGAGYENIDLEAAAQSGIAVANSPGKNAAAVAEHAMAMLLCLVRHIAGYDRQIKAGIYCSHLTGAVRGTVGLLGFGAIAREFAKLLKPFPVKVLAYDLYPDAETAQVLGVELVSMERLVAESDFFSIHIPRSPQTLGMINRQYISKMKDGAYIINTSRGGIINENDLSEALIRRKLSGAALDVFATEPVEPGNPLLVLDNVLLTPHTASASFDAYHAVMEYCAQSICDFYEGRELTSILNPKYIEKRK